MGTTNDLQLPYPEPTDANNPPAHIKALADQVQVVLLSRFTQGDDARLANARTPNGSAGGALKGTYPNPAIADALLDAAASTASLRTLGSGAQQAAAGNHRHYAPDIEPTAIEVASGWSGSVTFSRTSGWAALTVSIQRANFNVGDVIGVLPSGSRPKMVIYASSQYFGSTRSFQVDTNGAITVTGTAATGGMAGSTAYPAAP